MIIARHRLIALTTCVPDLVTSYTVLARQEDATARAMCDRWMADGRAKACVSRQSYAVRAVSVVCQHGTGRVRDVWALSGSGRRPRRCRLKRTDNSITSIHAVFGEIGRQKRGETNTRVTSRQIGMLLRCTRPVCSMQLASKISVRLSAANGSRGSTRVDAVSGGRQHYASRRRRRLPSGQPAIVHRLVCFAWFALLSANMSLSQGDKFAAFPATGASIVRRDQKGISGDRRERGEGAVSRFSLLVSL